MESEDAETGLSSRSWRVRTRRLDYPADHGERGRGDWTSSRSWRARNRKTGLSSGSWRARTLRLASACKPCLIAIERWRTENEKSVPPAKGRAVQTSPLRSINFSVIYNFLIFAIIFGILINMIELKGVFFVRTTSKCSV
jgi:hypothetical protein